MRKLILLFLPLLLLMMNGCADNAPKSTTNEEIKEQPVQVSAVERFKLFPTHNMWTFIKLDTQTGLMWQVQFSVQGDEYRFETPLNTVALANDSIAGRFELYPTQNIFNFVLLDKVEGNTWQVQWSNTDAENQAVIPIK